MADRSPESVPPNHLLSSSSSNTSSRKATDTHNNNNNNDNTASTTHDVESHRSTDAKNSFFGIVFDQAGVTDEIIAHPYPGQGTAEAPYVVDFLPGDPRNAFNFAEGYKWAITVLQAFATLAVTFTSSVYSGCIESVVADFHPSNEVAILGVSIFVLGFAIGPLVWAPFSEVYGRRLLFFGTYVMLTAFNAGSAAAPNMTGFIILRFLAGAFGSSPLTNAGGVIADMFVATERGIAGSIFAMAPFLGPSLGPIVGGFLGDAAGWRWVMGLAACFTGVILIIATLFCPETYAPVLLRRRAEALSKHTGKHYISKMELGKPKQTIAEKIKVSLSRPWIMLFKEPIVLLISIYMAIVYGTLYMCFAAFPIIYQQGRGWSPGVGGLAFLGIAVGMVAATVGTILDNKRYTRVSEAHGGFAPPEARLPPAIIGSVLLPVGLFWFAWTNSSGVHWIVSIIGSAFFAAGLVLVFLSLMNYLIDAYVIYAASVLAANSVLRSLFGFAFPMFTDYMYQGLGIHWASSVPAFLALACVPCPFLFYKYGEKIRMKCAFAAEAANVLRQIKSHADGPADNVPNGRGALQRSMTEKSHTSNVIPS